ncbi:hypothetical protein Taro_033812 [Colocasia esculenta]|uniref:Uncharacterized protein n=1 Tax=Colocasia esculenta TaxID=4460 RepID=A0A843W825_COLES|nr:hypothetical protein [Colocasia esculenta]
MPTFDSFDLLGLELKELGLRLGPAFSPRIPLLLGLLSSSSKPQQRVRAGHGGFREVAVRKQINNHTNDTRDLSWFDPSHMEVLCPVLKQPLGISLTKGAVPLKDTTTPSTPAETKSM